MDHDESLEVMRSRGDSIVKSALSSLVKHVLLIPPNLLSITQNPTTSRQAMSSHFVAEWREAEAKELQLLVQKKVYVGCSLPSECELVRIKRVFDTKRSVGG